MNNTPPIQRVTDMAHARHDVSASAWFHVKRCAMRYRMERLGIK
jgi:hypothetical protein